MRFNFSQHGFVLGLALFLGGCSLLTDFSECEVDGDCASGTCSEGICSDGAKELCETNVDCGDLGAGNVCLRGACALVDTSICQLDENLEVADAPLYHFGMLMPLSGTNGPKGIGITNGAKSAIDLINDTGGLGGKQLSLIACDTQNDPTIGVSAANHLADIGVRVMFGALLSDATIQIAENVSTLRDTVLISPASTSPRIGSIGSGTNLVWRTVPSDELQAKALVTLTEASSYEKLLILYADTAYGNGLRTSMTLYWSELGGRDVADDATFKTVPYTVESGELSTSYTQEVSEILADGAYIPDAIIVLGSAESQTIIAGLDSTFFDSLADQDKPNWILSDGGRDPGLFNSSFDAVKPRIRGTGPKQVAGAAFTQFQINFQGPYGLDPADHPYADNAFDAAFVASVAVAAQEDLFEATGSQVGAALLQVSSGTPFTPGEDIGSAANTIRAGDSINYVGASGDVDFDANGDTKAIIEEWGIALSGDAFSSEGDIIGIDGGVIVD